MVEYLPAVYKALGSIPIITTAPPASVRKQSVIAIDHLNKIILIRKADIGCVAYESTFHSAR